MSDKTPLVVLEEDCEDFRKEVEENLKKWSKLNSKNDSAYRNSLEQALSEIEEYRLEASELLADLSELSKDDEPATLKQKDFQKRQSAETKKVKDCLAKIEKSAKKLKADLDKQIKLDEKRNSSVVKHDVVADDTKETGTVAEPKENKAVDSNDIDEEPKTHEIVDSDEENDEAPLKEKGLKELMLEEQKKAEERKKSEQAAKLVPESKKDKEKRLKEEKKEEKRRKKEEEKKQKEEEKRLKKEGKRVEEAVESEIESEEEESEAESDTKVKTEELVAIAKSVRNIEEAGVSSGKNQELIKIIKEIKDIEGQFKQEEETELHNEPEIAKPKAVSTTSSGKKNQELIKMVKEMKAIALEEERELHHEPEIAKPKAISTTSSGKKNEELIKMVKEMKAIGLEEEQELQEVEKEMEDIENGMKETYEEELKVVPKSKQLIKSDEFEEGQKLVATVDIEPEEEGDLMVKQNEILTFLDYEEDPAWLEVETGNGRTGFVPRSKVKLYNEDDELIPPSVSEIKQEEKSSRWKLGKSKLKLESSEALKQSGAVPSTFSDAFLPALAAQHSYDTFLAIEPTKSNLNFKNFYWEAKENRLRSKLAQFQKLFVVHKCVNIPVPNKADLTVLSRTLNVCLFDGVSILSNIHTIRAHVIGKDEKTWSFEDEISDAVSISDLSEFFIRSNVMSENNLGVLFELSIYCRMNNTGEESDLCCGWAHLPFKDPVTKQQVTNKSYDLILNGGTVFEKKVPLGRGSSAAGGSGWNDLIAKMFKESKLKLNVKEPSNLMFDTLNCLPEPLVISSVTAPFIRYYREEIGNEFLAPLIEIGSFDATTEPIHSCFLSTFSEVLKQPDLLDAARFAFQLARENMKRDERNDNNKLRKVFIKVYTDICYPFLCLANVPEFDLKNHDSLEIRRTIIMNVAKMEKKKSVEKYLLDGNEEFRPFNADEIRFEILA